MKKVLIGALIVVLLTGCANNNIKEEKNTDEIFKEELVAVSKIGESKGKTLSDEIVVEEIKEVFDGIFNFAIFESHVEEYGEIIQGTGSDGNGGRLFCCKLPVNVKFVGTKESIHKFVEYFQEINNVISFGDFKVEELEDEKYEVTTLINFLGKAAGGVLSEGKKQYTLKKNEIEVKEEEELKLRDFDVSMVVRASNSDASAISLGVSNNSDYKLYSNGNSKKDINVKFSNEGNNYYCECSVDNEKGKKTIIKPNGNILFDILSCDVVEESDEIGVDLHIINASNKKASIIVYEDKDHRVNIVEKSGSIEVKEK